MRLAELDLVAFGRFTDRRLEFPSQAGPASPGRQGFHAIHGRNEAGKSTLLAALSGLLFGIERQSRYGFLDRDVPLTVGATLEAPDGSRLRFRRLKKNKNFLIDAAGNPLPRERLSRITGGVGRMFFERVFRLDHAQLLKAEEDLLTGGGDLGVTLVQAATGIGQLKRLIDDFGKEAGDLFLPRGSRKINKTIKALQDARKRERALRIPPAQWQALDTERIQALDAKDTCRRRLTEARAEQGRLHRIRRSLTPLAKCSDLRARLDGPLADAPDLSKADAERFADKLQARKAATDRRLEAEQRIAELKNRLTEQTADLNLLSLAADIREVAERRGDILSKRRDEPKLAARITAGLTDLRRDAAAVGLDPGTDGDPPVLPDPLALKAVERLAETYQTLQGDRHNARDAAERARAQLRRLTRERDALPPQMETAGLRQAVDRVHRHGNLDQNIPGLRATTESAREARDTELAKLPLFQGNPADLGALPIPLPETRRRVAQDWQDRADRATDLAGRVANGEAESRRVQIELARLEAAGAVPTEAALTAARAQRDDALQGLETGRDLAATDSRIALRTLKTLILDADRLADGLRADAARVAEHAALTRDLATRSDRLATDRRDLAAIRTEQARLASTWRKDWAVCGFEPLPPAEMEPWLERRDAVLSVQRALDSAKTDLLNAEEQSAAMRDSLAHALDALAEDAGIEPEIDRASLTALLEAATTAVDRATRLDVRRETLVKNLADREQERDLADAKQAALDADLADWTAAWRKALAAACLPPDDDPSVTRDRLQGIAGMREAVAILTEDRRRLDGIDRDRKAFDTDVAKLAQRVVPVDPAARIDGVALSRILEDKLTETEKVRDRRARDEQELDKETKRLHEAEQHWRVATEDLALLIAQVGVDEETVLRRAIGWAADKREVRDALEAQRDRLAEDWPGRDLAAIADACTGDTGEAADPSAIDADLDALGRDIEALDAGDQAARDRFAEVDARWRAIGGDGEAAIDAAEQIEDCTARLRREAEAFATPAVAAALLRRAVELYRQRHEEPVLAAARDLFARSTDGAFTGLDIDHDEDDVPRLIGIRNTGPDAPPAAAGLPARVHVDNMSDGTSAPLYLALRLAAMADHARRVGPLPFVADDLLVDLDNERSRATLRVLDKMADTFQVLFLTHHPHMVDLIKEEIPEARRNIVSLSE